MDLKYWELYAQQKMAETHNRIMARVYLRLARAEDKASRRIEAMTMRDMKRQAAMTPADVAEDAIRSSRDPDEA